MATGPTTLRELMDRNVQANLALLSRFGGLLRSVKTSTGQAGGRSSISLKDIAAEWANATLGYYATISDQSIRYLNSLTDSVEQALGTKPAAAAGAAKPVVRPEIPLRVQAGERVSARFQVENPLTESMDVRFAADEFVSAGGAKVPPACISFVPASIAIEPGASRVVEIQVDAAKDFKPGETYRSTIRVAGLNGREIGVVLEVVAKAKRPGKGK